MAKNFQLALRPNRTLTRKRNYAEITMPVPKLLSKGATMYLSQKGAQAASNAMARGYRTITKYAKRKYRESERATKKKLNRKKKSRKMTLRRNVMKLTGFRMYKGTVRGLRAQGAYVSSTDYGAGLTYCLSMQYIKSSSPTSTTFDYSLNKLFPSGIDLTSTFTWCPYHPGGSFGWWDRNMSLIDPTHSEATSFANYPSLHSGTPPSGINISNANYPNTIGPCNDNIEVHAPYSSPKVGLVNAAYYYTILGYTNRITVKNTSTDRPCVLHVLQIKFKSKCIHSDLVGPVNEEFYDGNAYWDLMTTGTSTARTVQFREAVTADMKRGKLNRKFVRTVSHKSMVLGEATNDHAAAQYPSRRTFTISGKCAIKRSRTCASSSALNESFDAAEQLNEAYQRDTYYMMYITPYEYAPGTATEFGQTVNVQFEVDKTVLYNLPSSNLN